MDNNSFIYSYLQINNCLIAELIQVNDISTGFQAMRGLCRFAIPSLCICLI